MTDKYSLPIDIPSYLLLLISYVFHTEAVMKVAVNQRVFINDENIDALSFGVIRYTEIE